MGRPEVMLSDDVQIFALVVTTEAEVEHHPDCPVCGEIDCVICHLGPEETL